MSMQVDAIQQNDPVHSFDESEFLLRWRIARLSAIAKSVQAFDTNSADNESDIVSENLTSENRDEILKNLYLHSYKLANSARRYFAKDYGLQDFKEFFKKADIACASGNWNENNGAVYLSRNGCSSNVGCSSDVCDYWRETIDGFTHGFSSNIRFVRHSSKGAGSNACVDVFYPEALEAEHKFNPIPKRLQEGLQEVIQRFAASKVDVLLIGESENTIYYMLESASGPLCGAGGKLMHESFERAVKAVDPKYVLLDASPVAVMGTEADQ